MDSTKHRTTVVVVIKYKTGAWNYIFFVVWQGNRESLIDNAITFESELTDGTEKNR